MSRPELGELSVGDEVFVIRANRGRRDDRSITKRAIPARVAKVARVWIDLESVERLSVMTGSRPQWSWRMRLDTQDEGNRQFSQYNSRFMTAEQLAWAERQEAAEQLLRQQGIRIDRLSAWDTDERRELLADLIHAALKDEPEQGR
jgi:hypothetical protein